MENRGDNGSAERSGTRGGASRVLGGIRRRTSPFKLKGTVVRMEWVNPHSWIHIDVKEPGGKVTRWMIEGGPPGSG